MILAFLGAAGQHFLRVCTFDALWSMVFTMWCILGVVKRQTISSLNNNSIVFESPSSVKHCKVGTLRGGRGGGGGHVYRIP